MVTPDELKAAGVKATLKPSLVIEDFAEGWEKEWFEKGNGGKAFKLRSPQFQPRPGSGLSIEIRSSQSGRIHLSLEKEKETYRHTIDIEGNDAWERVVLSPADFTMKETPLPEWKGVDIVITPAGAWDEFDLRDLRWI